MAESPAPIIDTDIRIIDKFLPILQEGIGLIGGFVPKPTGVIIFAFAFTIIPITAVREIVQSAFDRCLERGVYRKTGQPQRIREKFHGFISRLVKKS